MKRLPFPGSLSTCISPPISAARLRVMDIPSPVPEAARSPKRISRA